MTNWSKLSNFQRTAKVGLATDQWAFRNCELKDGEPFG